MMQTGHLNLHGGLVALPRPRYSTCWCSVRLSGADLLALECGAPGDEPRFRAGLDIGRPGHEAGVARNDDRRSPVSRMHVRGEPRITPRVWTGHSPAASNLIPRSTKPKSWLITVGEILRGFARLSPVRSAPSSVQRHSKYLLAPVAIDVTYPAR